MAFDYQSFKNEFPYFKSPNAVVYLDNAATALKPQALIDATSTFLSNRQAPCIVVSTKPHKQHNTKMLVT